MSAGCIIRQLLVSSLYQFEKRNIPGGQKIYFRFNVINYAYAFPAMTCQHGSRAKDFHLSCILKVSVKEKFIDLQVRKFLELKKFTQAHTDPLCPPYRSSPQACRCMRCMQQTLTRGWMERSAMPSCRLEQVTETGKTSTSMPCLESSQLLWNWTEKSRPSTAWVSCVCAVNGFKCIVMYVSNWVQTTLSAYHCGPWHGPASALRDHTASTGGAVGHWRQWTCLPQTTSECDALLIRSSVVIWT